MLLIDTDPGLDDAHALAMALTRLPAEELMVTTVHGNVGLDAVTANAAWILGRLAPSVKLYAGAANPLLGTAVDAAHIHGEDGLWGVDHSQEARVAVQDTVAAQAIVEAAWVYGRELTIVALGPLTNVAVALALEPRLPELIGRLVVMGGSPAGQGNASPNAEFNVFADPVAAEMVFSRMPGLTLITWDLCLQIRFTAEELESMWASHRPAAELLRQIHDHRRANDARYAASTSFGRADPLAMAVALDPSLVDSRARHRVHVGYDDGLAHGATVVDWRDETPPDRSAVELVLGLHRSELFDMLTL